MSMNKAKKKAFEKLQNAYSEMMDCTKMSDIEYKALLEVWDKISILWEVEKHYTKIM